MMMIGFVRAFVLDERQGREDAHRRVVQGEPPHRPSESPTQGSGSHTLSLSETSPDMVSMVVFSLKYLLLLQHVTLQ